MAGKLTHGQELTVAKLRLRIAAHKVDLGVRRATHTASSALHVLGRGKAGVGGLGLLMGVFLVRRLIARWR